MPYNTILHVGIHIWPYKRVSWPPKPVKLIFCTINRVPLNYTNSDRLDSSQCSVIALKRQRQAVLTLADAIPGERDGIYTCRLEKRREIRGRVSVPELTKTFYPDSVGPSCAEIYDPWYSL